MKRFFISVMIVFSLVFLFDSCQKKVKTEPVKPPEKVEKVEELTPKVEKPVLTAEEIFQKKSLEEINREGHLNRVNFDFDKYFIREDMKTILQKNAEWLLTHPSVFISVEGHCDERGTIEYNMALGEKRAKSAMEYMTSLGVPSIRIQVISYGKNKPLVSGASSEEENFMNRRAESVIIKK